MDLIQKAYNGEAWEILNNSIRGQHISSVSVYIEEATKLLTYFSFYGVLVALLLLYAEFLIRRRALFATLLSVVFTVALPG